jgi:hypothetical protein
MWHMFVGNCLRNWRWWVALPLLIPIYIIVLALNVIALIGEGMQWAAERVLETEYHPFQPLTRFVRKGWTVHRRPK